MQCCSIFWGHIYTHRLSVGAKGTCPSDFCLLKNLAFSLVYVTLHPVECYSLQFSSHHRLQNISYQSNKQPYHFSLHVSLLFLWVWAAGLLTSPVTVDCHGLLVKEKERVLKRKGNTVEKLPVCPTLHPVFYPTMPTWWFIKTTFLFGFNFQLQFRDTVFFF